MRNEITHRAADQREETRIRVMGAHFSRAGARWFPFRYPAAPAKTLAFAMLQ